MNGDSFALGEEIQKYTSCFSYFNNSIIENNSKKIDLKYSIILEKEKYSEYSKDDLSIFFSSIKQTGIIDFEEEYKDNGDLYLNLKYEKQNKAYLQYTGMIVRCLYQKDNDEFEIIAKHFINLCKYFNNIDKGLLFTIACNIFCAQRSFLGRYGFNYNHILMEPSGCILLKTDKIIKLLDKNNGINHNFSKRIDEDNYKLQDYSKESYLKIIKQNGIE
jgi:hypothetical protein